MISLLVILPHLFTFLIISVCGHRLGHNGCSIISFISSIISFISSIISLFVFVKLKKSDIIFVIMGKWFESGDLEVYWNILFDPLSIIMLMLVSCVSMVVQVYSFNYMQLDPYKSRFISYIALFTFFMNILVVSSNLGLLLMGWEGVGLCSFLLISFWNNRLSAAKAALKAILFNRIGDMGFLIAVGLLYYFLRSLEFSVIFNLLPFYSYSFFFWDYFININIIDLIFFFLIFGVVGKSAQIGLHVWLLDAMEGPTPVSSLIHAATMVTAGVFLLIKLSFLFDNLLFIKALIAIIGVFTAFLSSLIGSLQNDLKSIIAYSTCSQLGYMVALSGCSSFNSVFFHLINHGYFKAMLFLCAGIIIHNFQEEQDIRKMGGLFFLFPLTFAFLLIGSFSIMGLPFLSGFYSKDYLIEISSILPFFWSTLVYHLLLSSAFFTSFYSLRLLYYSMISKPLGYKYVYTTVKESYSVLMLFGISILSFGSIFSGYILKDIFISNGSLFLASSVNYSSIFESNYFTYLEFFFYKKVGLWLSLKILPMYFVLFGFLFFYTISQNNVLVNFWLKLNSSFFYSKIYSFVFNGFFFNNVFINYVLFFFNTFSWNLYLVEKLFFESFSGPLSFSESFFKVSYSYNKLLKNSYLQNNLYMLAYFAFFVICVLFLTF